MEVVQDLVEPCDRLREVITSTFMMFHSFPDAEFYDEYRVRADNNSLGRIMESREAGDRFLTFLLNDATETRVVWITDTLFLLCEGPDSYWYDAGLGYVLQEMNFGGAHLSVTDHEFEYGIRLHDTSVTEVPDPAPAIFDTFLDVLARKTSVASVDLTDASRYATERGFEAFVTNSQSPRVLFLQTHVSMDTGRILAFRCNRHIELRVGSSFTYDHVNVASLAEAISLDQGPASLDLVSLRHDSATLLGPAIATTSCLAKLTVTLGGWKHEMWLESFAESIGRSRGIRTLVGETPQYERFTCNNVKLFWRSVMTSSTTIEAVDVQGICHAFPAEEKVECAQAVATALLANRVVTRIEYNPDNHDPEVMRVRVLPLLRLNRLRPIVASLDDGGSASADGARGASSSCKLSALLESKIIRMRPELLFFLMKAQTNLLLPLPRGADDSSRVSGRKRPGPM
jgi:hypothetical protein